MTAWTPATLYLQRQPDGTLGGSMVYDGLTVEVRNWTKAGTGTIRCELHWPGDGWVEAYTERRGAVLRGG